MTFVLVVMIGAAVLLYVSAVENISLALVWQRVLSGDLFSSPAGQDRRAP